MTGADVERAGDRLEREPMPVALTSAQVRGSGIRHDAQTPLPVTAWVPHRVSYVDQLRIDAVAIAWTRGAVLLRWVPEGSSQTMHAWVWANAVRRRQ